MKLYPDLIKLAKEKTKNWTIWEYEIPGYGEIRDRRSALLPSTMNYYNIYHSRINNNFIVEKYTNKIFIRNISESEPIIKFKI